MGLFSSLWAASAAPLFAASRDLELTYYPEGAASRVIEADIDTGYRGGRRGRKIDPEQHHLTEYEWIQLVVDNDATTGMTHPGLGDAIEIAGDTGRWDFWSVIARDSSEMTVEWRRATLRRAGQAQPARL